MTDLLPRAGEAPGGVRRVAPVAVVSLVYRQHGSELADHVRKLGRLDPIPAALYLVNNESGRAVRTELDEVAGELPEVVVVEPGTNLGFAGGVNAAVAAAAAGGLGTVLILNTDVEILSEDLIGRLLDARAKTGTDFVSPTITSFPDTGAVWYRGATCRRPGWITRHPGIGRPWTASQTRLRPTDVGCSCCMLVSVDAFERLGGFEERLFMYFEDAELAERARAAGFRTLLLDEPLVAHHKEGRRLSAREAYFFARNPLLLISWHERRLARLAGTALHLAAALRYLARARGAGARRALARGLVDGLAGRAGPPRLEGGP